MPDYRRGLVLLLAMVIGVAIASRLGFWQLDRAAQKVALQTALDGRSHLPALDGRALARTAAGADAQNYRSVNLVGRWRPEHTVFLDNRQMDGKVGFFVVTPLTIEGTSDAVVVQRGWVARNFADRAVLPSIATPPGRVALTGRVAPSPSRLFQFDSAASGPIRQNLEIPAYASESGLALLPLSVLQLEAAGTVDSLSRHWPLPASDVQKHYGYAFQWFAIAAGILFLYVWHRFIRPRARRR